MCIFIGMKYKVFTSTFFLLRTCEGASCDGEVFQTITEDCNIQDCVCRLSFDAYKDQFGVNPPSGPLGWVESDGVEGQGNAEVTVQIGDELALGDTLQISLDDECGHW